MSYLSRAEAIIQGEVGEEQLFERQENQSAAFKVHTLLISLIYSFIYLSE